MDFENDFGKTSGYFKSRDWDKVSIWRDKIVSKYKEKTEIKTDKYKL